MSSMEYIYIYKSPEKKKKKNLLIDKQRFDPVEKIVDGTNASRLHNLEDNISPTPTAASVAMKSC